MSDILEVKPNGLSFEQRYDDDSGVEFAVRLLADGGIQFEACDKVDFPPGQIKWLIACLQYIEGALG